MWDQIASASIIHQPENSSHTSRGFMGVHYVAKIDYVIGHWQLIKSLAPLPSTEVKDGANVSNSLIIGFLVTSSHPVTVKGPPLPTTSHLIITHVTFLSLQGFQAVKNLCAGTSLMVQ